MKQDHTHITLVVDRSGSMNAIATDAQGGINELVKDQKKEPGTASFYLAQFDDVHDDVYGPADLQGFDKYTLVPRNNTALYDAVGRSIVKTGEYLDKMAEADKPAKVIFAIVTDGFENASKEWKADKVKELITKQTETYNWQFVFIGANIDAYATGAGIGVSNTSQYYGTRASTQAVYTGASQTMSNYRNTAEATYMGAVASVDAAGTSEKVATKWDPVAKAWVMDDEDTKTTSKS